MNETVGLRAALDALRTEITDAIADLQVMETSDEISPKHVGHHLHLLRHRMFEVERETSILGGSLIGRKPQAGRCIYCGCMGAVGCVLGQSTCSWIDASETVCSRPECMAKHEAGKKRKGARR